MHHLLTFLQILNRAASSEVGKWLTARSRLSSCSACATLPPGESPAAVSNVHVTPLRRYLLISPCRDEAQYLRRTLDSVAAQSVPPALWVVVDDGSTDDTPTILEAYARRLPYLRVVRRADRGGRQVGPGVIAAFYSGLETVHLEDFDYVCKLDMDLDLPVRYFELLMQRMEGEPRIGTTSGKPIRPSANRGAGAGLWRRDVGRHDQDSVSPVWGDRRRASGPVGRIDCHRARMLGWLAESVDLEPIRLSTCTAAPATGHLTAAAVGFGQYFMGTCRSTIWPSPSIACRPTRYWSGVCMLWGYFRSWLKGLQRYDDSSSGASCAPTSTPACAWAAGRHGPGQHRASPALAYHAPGPGF